MDGDEWDPMTEDFNSVLFNSYNHGAGANLENLPQNQNSNTKQGVSLYIVGLPLSFTNEALKNLFSPFGKVLRAYCSSKPPNQYQFGFVDFGSTKEALEALSEMNNKNVGSGTLKITFAKKSADKLEQHKKEHFQDTRKKVESYRNPKMNGSMNSSRSPSSTDSYSADYQKINLTMVVPNDHSSTMNGNPSMKNGYKNEYYVGLNKLPQRNICMDKATSSDLGLHLSHLANGNVNGYSPVVTAKPRACHNCDCLAFFRCGSCRVAWYCGQVCQIEAWPNHRIDCDIDRSPKTSGNVVKVSDVMFENTHPPPPSNRRRQVDVSPNEVPKKSFNHNVFKEMPQTVEPLRKPKLLGMNSPNQSSTKPQQQKLLLSPETTPTAVIRGVTSLVSKHKELPLSVLKTENLRVGEILQLGVVWTTESPDEVWFSVIDGDILFKIKAIEEKLNLDAVGKKLPKMRVGDIIAAQALDQSWYRAMVLEVEEFSAKVFFIDYGNEEVVNNFTELSNEDLNIPSVLLKAKVQSTEDSLKKLQTINTLVVGNLLFLNDNEALFEWLDQQDESVSLGHLLCHHWRREFKSLIGTGASQDICYENALESLFKPFHSVSMKDNHTDVYAIWVVNSENVFIQKKSEELDLIALMKKLDEYTKNKKNGRKALPKEGNYVCAQFSDKQWYRAKVCSVDGALGTVKVYLLDYGNEALVSVEEILPLPSEFLLHVPFAYHVALDGVCDLKHEFAELLIDQVWKIEIIPQKFPERERIAKVRLMNDNMCFNDYVNETSKPKIISKESSHKASANTPNQTIPKVSSREMSSKSTKKIEETIKLEDIPKTVLEVGSRAMLLVNQFESLNSFVCTDLDPKFLLTFLELNEKIESFCKLATSNPGFKPIKGDVVLAMFSEDNCWYRAVVMEEMVENEALVFFIDYGNFETVSYASMLRLPPTFATVKAQAVCVALHGVIERNKWGSDIVKPLKAIFAETQNRIECEIVNFNEEQELYEISMPSMNDFLKSKDLMVKSPQDDKVAEMLAQIELLKAEVAKCQKE